MKKCSKAFLRHKSAYTKVDFNSREIGWRNLWPGFLSKTLLSWFPCVPTKWPAGRGRTDRISFCGEGARPWRVLERKLVEFGRGSLWSAVRFGAARHRSAPFGAARHRSAPFGAARHRSAPFGAALQRSASATEFPRIGNMQIMSVE